MFDAVEFATPEWVDWFSNRRLLEPVGNCLPAEAEAACDQLCLIPMRGGADSLNLAQATAIMTYEAWRQRDFT